MKLIILSLGITALLILAASLSVDVSLKETQAEIPVENEIIPYPQENGVVCYVWNQYRGSGDDNEMECVKIKEN